MADINHVISLGLGSPAAIPEIMTFGLQISIVIHADAHSDRLFWVAPETRCFGVPSDSRFPKVPQETRFFDA